MEQKYLGQIIKEEGMKLGSNTIILAPVGSGKTHYILNDLSLDKRVLYLCDTGNLRDSVKKAIDEEELQDFMYRIDVMCYESFGRRVVDDTLNKFINSYHMIVCDEVHNLIDFANIKGQNKGHLLVARSKLLQKYEDTQIVLFTATPYYLDKLEEINKDIYHYFIRYDYRDRPNIRRYIENRMAYINNMSQIKMVLNEYIQAFTFRDMKSLIFTMTIDDMIKIEEDCKEVGLKPICIWSASAKNHSLSEEQLRVREHLLTHGELAEPYNVLIINRATETGVNIYDKNMNLVIVNDINPTRITQVRGRVRHDVDLLMVKTKYANEVKLPIVIDENLLDKQMTKAEFEQLVSGYKLRDGKRRTYTVNKFAKALEDNGYRVETKRKTINGKKITMYAITNK